MEYKKANARVSARQPW